MSGLTDADVRSAVARLRQQAEAFGRTEPLSADDYDRFARALLPAARRVVAREAEQAKRRRAARRGGVA